MTMIERTDTSSLIDCRPVTSVCLIIFVKSAQAPSNQNCMELPLQAGVLSSARQACPQVLVRQPRLPHRTHWPSRGLNFRAAGPFPENDSEE